MRRPVSDIRQREYVRHSLHENITCRRRNSSLPLHTVHALSMNQNTLDNDTDFLCDRIIEFMESGDIYSIVSVELAEQSIYFERLLHYHKGNGNIRLPEFLNPGFSSILEYIHKGVTEINNDNVYHIFIAADFFLITKLKEQCTNVLKEIINNSTIAISLWLTCHSLYWPEINKMVYEKILDNFEVIWRSKDFQYLHPYDVYQILNEDELNCKEEKNIFNAIVKWINENINTRIQYTLELLLCIRIGMLSPLEFDYIKNHELISIIPEYLDILNQWPNCLTMTNNPIISVYGKYFITPRLPNEVVMVFGGWCDGEGPTAAVQVYNPRANIWTLWTKTGHQSQLPANEWLSRLLQDSSDLTIVNESQTNSLQNAVDTVNIINNLRSSLPPDGVNLKQNKSVLFTDNIGVTENSGCLIGEIPRRVYAGCVLVDKRVYLVGGFDGSNALKSTLCYDFEIDSGWYEISCMYEKRYYVSVVYSNNHIYALGGHNGENQGRLDSAERYILNENLWQSITSMNRVRSDAAAAELNGKVYVAGGFEGRHYHDSVEYYEPVTNQWTLINRMNSPRGGISLIQHNGYLYAIGGNDGNNRLKSIEQYNPNDNKWEIVGQMNRCKSNLSSTVVNDEIYIFGGWSDEPEAGILDLVECYNTVSRKCHIVRSLIFPASATCACTLKDRDLVKKYISIQTSSYSKPPFGTFLLHNTGQLLSPDQNISTGNFFSSQQNMNNNLQVNGNKTFTGIKIQSNQLYPDHQNEERMKFLDETISEYTIASVDHDDDDDDNGITGENRQNQLHLSATSSMIIPHRDININSSSNNNSSSINHRNIDENYILLQVSNSLTYNQSSWRKGSRKNCKRKTIRRV